MLRSRSMTHRDALMLGRSYVRAANRRAGVAALGVATMVLVTSQMPAIAAVPTTVADLDAALCGGATVQLGQAIDDASAVLSVGAGCVATLDLKGFDLTVSRVELGAGADLTIRDTSGPADGQLIAEGKELDEPGISTTGATLRIMGGAITATGGRDGAGIGGGYREDGGTLVISGGTVIASAGTATFGSSAAGIGGGSEGGTGTVTISGGTVMASGHVTGGYYGPGIGPGDEATTAGSITISGGTVTATGAEYGAGIGGAYASVGDTITISGGTVTATGGDYGAGIGSGERPAAAATIVISGGTVTATGGVEGAGVGGGSRGAGGTITISGGTLTASGGTSAAGLGGGAGGDGGSIAITGGSVTATSGFVATWFGIGGGDGGVEGTVSIAPGIVRVDAVQTTTLTSPAASSSSSSGSPVASRPVLVGGAVPTVAPGSGTWVQADGSSVALVASSPAPNAVRYSADGIQVTLTGAPGSSASAGLVATAAGEVECEICAVLAAGGVVEAWMFSEPRLVAAWRVEELPCQRFTIPIGVPLDGGAAVVAGTHTLQLSFPTESGSQAVNIGVTVGGPVPGSIPAGEGLQEVPVRSAPILLLGGVLLAGVLVHRRVVRAD